MSHCGGFPQTALALFEHVSIQYRGNERECLDRSCNTDHKAILVLSITPEMGCNIFAVVTVMWDS